MTLLTNYNDAYCPFFILEANNALAADIAADVVSLKYTEDEMKSDELELVVSNAYSKYTDDPRFATGATFKVRWGYYNDVSDVRSCIIRKAHPTFGAGNLPTITVKAFDTSIVMGKGAKAKNWGPITSSAVAKRIAGLYRLNVDIEDSDDARKEGRIQPAGVTDIQFLMNLASKLAWDCYIDGGTLHFHKKRLALPPDFTFYYYTHSNPTVLSFDPSVKMDNPNKTKASGCDSTTGAKATGVGGFLAKIANKYGVDTNGARTSTDSESRPANATTQQTTGRTTRIGTTSNNISWANRVSGKDGRGDVSVSSAESNPKVVQKHAEGSQTKIDLSANEAQLKVVGTPKLKARRNVNIQGVGKTYSGNWRVAHCEHSFSPDQGYVTSCKLSRNALPKGDKKLVGCKAPQGDPGKLRGEGTGVDTTSSRTSRKRGVTLGTAGNRLSVEDY